MMTRFQRFRTAAAAVAFALAVTCVLPAENARILAVETVAAKSHWNFMSSVLRALTESGHSVTVVTPFPEGNKENYTEVDTSDILPTMVGIDLTKLKRMYGTAASLVSLSLTQRRFNCERIYNDRRIVDLMADNRDGNFDAIFVHPGLPVCMAYVTASTDLPVVYVVPMATTFFADRRTVGDVSNPASASSILARYAVPRTFAQRFSNTLLSLCTEAYVALHACTVKFLAGRKPYDTYAPVPPSVVFTNGHYISDAARPISANVVNVGGIHLKPPERIPKDILEFIEDSPYGVVLFTFGSTVLMSSMPDHIRTAFLEALAQLPHRTLMKYEVEMIDKPNNVMIRKWLPQRDILMHPKVKLFISHGGISGVYEAVDAGVPVLGFPFFGDQYRNIDNLVEAGMAISMEILSVTKDDVFNNLVELINDRKYKKNAEIASSIFKDRPMSPQQSVVYWTEYVIRHKGAPHLKSHALNLSWYQYFLLDVIAVVLILISIVSYVIYRVFKLLCQYSFKRYFSVIEENRSHRLKND
ncbi:UDP-glucuronosyl/UDP-glucosyltransferase [Cinara cedri]|uniref:UDP-glucuronosyltransferase n=1 Tax=Cinara cedri TaxID=506608 RepID=A0A5E4MP12_9HEMI|nr:UDP-glucuronosyl/UDP-glucosyltransferase [Cinara cedri]